MPRGPCSGSRGGTVTHYFSHLSVAAVQLTAPLALGERIHIRGHTTDLVQDVASMEVEHRKVEHAGPGDGVALRAQTTSATTTSSFGRPDRTLASG
jgi:hypothetical protein